MTISRIIDGLAGTARVARCCCTTALALCLMATTSDASQVVKSISTGWDDATNTRLANNASDTDYVIGPGGTGGHTGEVPFARTSPIAPSYVADSASTTSRWIALSGTGEAGLSVGQGTYFFDTSVDLTGYQAVSAQISSLLYATDNQLVGIRINGVSVYSQAFNDFAEEFRTFHNLGDLGLGGFHAGINTIRFEAYNAPGLFGNAPNDLALRIDAVVTAAVPEPTTASLAAIGLVCLAWRFKRLRKLRGETGRSA
jgi:hypothetical protein